MSRPRYRMLALDVDGTLLNRWGELLPSTKAAVARAAAAGIRPILCTGRRYRRAWPVAEMLGLDAPIVCNSGSIVKEPSDDRTLWRADLDPGLAAALLDLFREHGHDVVAFNDRPHDQPDFRVSRHPSGRGPFDDYVGQNLSHAEIAADWAAGPFFHVCAVGLREEMLAFQSHVLDAFGDRVRTFVQKSPRYAGTMCEVIRADASKWSAVLHVAEQWGVAPEEICAVGDDVNDVPMIRGAGLGVAMGHAAPEVLAAADLVVPDHDNDGVAALIDGRLL
ncbi:HAD family hydrolase [Paludisphaera mucosa]|uniref:HAD family hydrolase n=1 Tax=Paludisphaera mucosa TaxID=3030827 RepID=A0ABT6FH98_9BACT|nr:HAD family hydrolase [Paludisphaera mucosa]MDG3006917.1 HAD family hydrolase [Paludisphaera mucosa]